MAIYVKTENGAERIVPYGFSEVWVKTENGADLLYKVQKGTPLSSCAPGSIVKIGVGGSATDFLIVSQGKPSDLYDESCNGTWVLMKDIYENRIWDDTNNDYANSDLCAWLNSTFFNQLDIKIRTAVKQVKIPYRAGSGNSGTVSSGTNGLNTKIFLLSGTETGLVDGYLPPNEGTKLSYFANTATSGAEPLRVANLDGRAAVWWLRSPSLSGAYGGTALMSSVNATGAWANFAYNTSYGVRPAMVLPSDLLVLDDGSVSG